MPIPLKTISLKRSAVFIFALASQAFATELRIYPSFAEVRTPVKATGSSYQVDLTSPAFAGLLAGTLDLEGLNYLQAAMSSTSTTKNWLQTQEGKTVVLREGTKVQKVTLVRAADKLIKDSDGVYRRVKLEQLSFVNLPPLEMVKRSRTQKVTFSLVRPGQGTLSYLTNRLNWSPRYTLIASGKSAALSALADIRNTSGAAFQVSAAELFAGQVEITTGTLENAAYAQAVRPENVPAPMPTASSSTQDVAVRPSLGGLYRFRVNKSFALAAGETITLPFLKAQVTTFERYAKLSSNNQDWQYGPAQASSSGVLQRGYRFKTDQNLPAGRLTIREEGRLVGQTDVLEVARGQNVDFTLGRDPDVRYVRRVELIKSERNSKPARAVDTYNVMYILESSKASPVVVELSDRFGARKVKLFGAVQGKNGLARLRLSVPAGGKITKSFVVVLNDQ